MRRRCLTSVEDLHMYTHICEHMCTYPQANICQKQIKLRCHQDTFLLKQSTGCLFPCLSWQQRLQRVTDSWPLPGSMWKHSQSPYFFHVLLLLFCAQFHLYNIGKCSCSNTNWLSAYNPSAVLLSPSPCKGACSRVPILRMQTALL